MKTVNLLIKPASGLCNLSCRYCFYNDVMSHRESGNLGLMSEKTLESLVRQAFSCESKYVSFAFQGGEPTLAGLNFFRLFIDLEKKYASPGVIVQHSIQTNGILLNEEWASFFHDNHFLVGISLDGNSKTHNANRYSLTGDGTFNKVTRAIQLLNDARADYNILCVVNAQTAQKAKQIYQYFKKRGYFYLQFIPCLDPLDAKRGQQPFSLTPHDYEIFLKTLFDLWYADFIKGDYVSIRLFDDYVGILMGRPAGTCATSGTCGGYLVAESDGSIYPCDFFVLDEWRIGKIGEQTFSQLFENDKYIRFIEQSHLLPSKCSKCTYIAICNGGCRRDRYIDGGETNNYFCSAFQGFFSYSYDRLKHVARIVSELNKSI